MDLGSYSNLIEIKEKFNDLENNWQEFKLKEPKWWQEFLRNLKS